MVLEVWSQTTNNSIIWGIVRNENYQDLMSQKLCDEFQKFLSKKKKKMKICSVCLFLWRKYSYRGQCATKSNEVSVKAQKCYTTAGGGFWFENH